MEILFRREVGVPGRDTAGAIVERADEGFARRIAAGLQPLVASRRTVGRHLGERADAAVMGAVEHDRPILAVAGDLDHGNAVRSHLDVDQLLGHVLEAGRVLTFLQGREHQLFVGVFVIDAKQPVAAAAVDRKIGDVVVVVAKLP